MPRDIVLFYLATTLYHVSCWFANFWGSFVSVWSCPVFLDNTFMFLSVLVVALKCINIACQFIKDKNRTVVQKYPCQLQVLTLTARKTHTVLTPPFSLRLFWIHFSKSTVWVLFCFIGYDCELFFRAFQQQLIAHALRRSWCKICLCSARRNKGTAMR